jgi:hypothetical protein
MIPLRFCRVDGAVAGRLALLLLLMGVPAFGDAAANPSTSQPQPNNFSSGPPSSALGPGPFESNNNFRPAELDESRRIRGTPNTQFSQTHLDPSWNGYFYFDGAYYYYRDVGTTPARSEANSRLFYFPPWPPVLDAPLPVSNYPHLDRGPRLERLILEPFYTPYASRRAAWFGTDEVRSRIDEYLQRRDELLRELREQIENGRRESTAIMTERLSALASAQAPRIQELETEAEALRAELVPSGLSRYFFASLDWDIDRPWRLGVEDRQLPAAETLGFEFKVLRAAIYFQPGLSPEQRRLLREIALEVQIETFAPGHGTAPRQQRPFSFLPEGAQLILPPASTPSLEVRITDFNDLKNGLKQELRTALYKMDTRKPAEREAQLQQLARDQRPRFAQLEVDAEAIRIAVSRLPEFHQAGQTPFPPALAARVEAYQTKKKSLQRTIQNKLEEIRRSLEPSSATFRHVLTSDGGEALVIDAKDPAPPREKLQAARAELRLLNQQNTPEFELLNRMNDQIRSETAAWSEQTVSGNKGRSIDDLLKDFESENRRQKTAAVYQDYRDAVFLPGLSPEQRRLLFAGAIEQLNLPLPKGEPFPWR